MIASLFLIAFRAICTAHAEYAKRTKFARAASGALDIGLYGYANPALISYVEGLEQGVAWSDSRFRPLFFARAYWALTRSPPLNSTTCNFASSTMGYPCC